jgi:hypothetical protein
MLYYSNLFVKYQKHFEKCKNWSFHLANYLYYQTLFWTQFDNKLFYQQWLLRKLILNKEKLCIGNCKTRSKQIQCKITELIRMITIFKPFSINIVII